MQLEEALVQAVDSVGKLIEELRRIPAADPRQIAVVRTQFETAFLWAANAAGGESLFNG